MSSHHRPFDYHPGGNPPYEPPCQQLTISDVERLAKAGVTMSFTDIAAQVRPDYTPVPEASPWPNSLSESFWQRWKRANPMTYGMGGMMPYQIFAVEAKDTVYVFVAPSDESPPFILEDSKPLYPSDALMAKLALHKRTNP